MGHNTIKAMLKTMFKEAGLNADKITNHSLRATATTRMIDAGIPEKVIMDRTGHHGSNRSSLSGWTETIL